MLYHLFFSVLVTLSILELVYSMSAYCILNEDQDSGVSGYVKFYQENITQPTTITAHITGLSPDAFHGFHIHQFANFSAGCISAGPHYNPFSHTHGSPKDDERHVGDMGNILADDFGVGDLTYNDSVISLFGDFTVIGRACVVHEREDDLGVTNAPDSLTTGNAGARIACGGIVQGDLEVDAQEPSRLSAFIMRLLMLGGIGGLFYYFFIHRRKQTYQDYA